MRQYASAQEVRAVGALGGYDKDRGRLDMRLGELTVVLSLDAHSMHHFTHLDAQASPSALSCST